MGLGRNLEGRIRSIDCLMSRSSGRSGNLDGIYSSRRMKKVEGNDSEAASLLWEWEIVVCGEKW